MAFVGSSEEVSQIEHDIRQFVDMIHNIHDDSPNVIQVIKLGLDVVSEVVNPTSAVEEQWMDVVGDVPESK